MGRYDFDNTEPSQDAPQEKEKIQAKSRNLIEAMEVQLAFETFGAQWIIKIRKEGKTEWEKITQRNRQGYYENIIFNTAEQARQWCQQVGLI